MLLTEAHSTYR